MPLFRNVFYFGFFCAFLRLIASILGLGMDLVRTNGGMGNLGNLGK
jgi:hypothetical protein